MYLIKKKTSQRAYKLKDEKVRELNDKFQPIEIFYHHLNLEIEKLLKEPSEERINKALRLITFKDSHAYMLYPKWYEDKEIAEINDYLDQIKELLMH